MEGDGRARGGRRQKDLAWSWEQWLVLLNVTPSPSLAQSASLELQMLLSKTRHDPYWTDESAEKQSCQEIAQGSPACKCPISIATQLYQSCYYCTPSLGRQGKESQKITE